MNTSTLAALTTIKELNATRAVLSDLIQERLPHVYVVQTEGTNQEVIGVCVTLEVAKALVEGRMGVKLEWNHSNSHGNTWWVKNNGTGIITEHEILVEK